MSPIKGISWTFFCALCFLCLSCVRPVETPAPVKVIFDTDMGPDYDDVGAIAMLHAFADHEEAEILATIASTKYEGVAAVLDVLNTYFKRPDLPIGVPKGNAVTLKDFQHWTDTLIGRYPHSITANNEAADAVSLYRKVLAAQKDKSVTIITVGFLTNISNVLRSPADEYSSLSGKELIHKKVKQLVSMAGKFPEGIEFNIEEDAAAASYVFENFENPILLSGFEIGEKIKSGIPLIRNERIQNSPVKDVFRISIPLAKEDSAGRMSWDETAVLVGIRGPAPFYKLQTGTIEVEDNGFNRFKEEEDGKHAHLVPDKPISEVQKLINDLMMHQPQE
jgi:pyrimidine-specific ribonucleoside hydrolase